MMFMYDHAALVIICLKGLLDGLFNWILEFSAPSFSAPLPPLSRRQRGWEKKGGWGGAGARRMTQAWHVTITPQVMHRPNFAMRGIELSPELGTEQNQDNHDYVLTHQEN